MKSKKERESIRGCLWLGGGRNGEFPPVVKGFFSRDDNILKIETILAQCCECAKNCWIKNFARVNFTVWELCSNKDVVNKNSKGTRRHVRRN